MKNGKCSVCENKGESRTKNGIVYCSKHYQQIRRCGKILDRTILTKNEIRIIGEICEMDLYDKNYNVSATTIFDKKYLNKVKKYKWSNSHGYASHIRSRVRFHRIILGVKKGQSVDHINRNKLDNRISNLRIADQSQNMANKGMQSNNKSGHVGICWDKKNKKWMVKLNFRRKDYWLGRHTNIDDAIKIRNIKQKEIFGEYNPIVNPEVLNDYL